LETVVGGGTEDTAMDDFVGIVGENLVGQGISNVTGDSYPPPCLFFAGRERNVRVKVEDGFIESVFKESGYVLKSSVSEFSWNLVVQRFVRTHVMDISNVLTCEQP
jgi:hypothetical protein